MVSSLAICVAAGLVVPASATPAQTQAAADRAALERAVAQYDAARAHASEVEARAAGVSADLDRLIAEESQARARLRSRAVAIYRSDDGGFISVLLGASSLQEFVSRWDLLTRLARQDAVDLQAVKSAREQAQQSAEELLELQAQAARAVDDLEAQVATARTELAVSEAAVREYEARVAASAQAARESAPAAPPAADRTQQLTGSGEWLTAVASHYGRNFTGRGASGEEIGPYSMIVAHRTLAFGTLIEFEYHGRRAVARVADRGPHVAGREFDLGPGVVRVLDFSGVDEVRYRIIGR